MQRPFGVTIVALLFCCAGVYLWSIGATLLISPGTVSILAGRDFMYGLELAGPYMTLLVGTAWGLVGWGLFRLHNWARWLAMLAMVLGVAGLVPKISLAQLGVAIFWYGLEIALRVAVGWYLAQAPAVIDAFSTKS